MFGSWETGLITKTLNSKLIICENEINVGLWCLSYLYAVELLLLVHHAQVKIAGETKTA